ncbi:MAG: hypothetical protein PUF12_01295 [Thermoflexaceae bacterium]|nr:hypothetical protein [Thermoflexaceae bacterium]
MAFCENCGRELKDGEVCGCTDTNKSEKAAQFDEVSAKVKEETGKAVGSMVSLIKAVLASPSEAVEEYVTGQDKKTAYQLIALETAGFTLANVVAKLIRMLLNGYSYRFSTFLTGILQDIGLVIGSMAVAAFIIVFMAEKYGDAKISFNKGLAIASLQSIVITPIYVCYALIGAFGVSILTGVASSVYSAARCLAIVLTYFGFSVVVADRKKLFYGLGVYSIVLSILSYVITSLI